MSAGQWGCYFLGAAAMRFSRATLCLIVGTYTLSRRAGGGRTPTSAVVQNPTCGGCAVAIEAAVWTNL